MVKYEIDGGRIIVDGKVYPILRKQGTVIEYYDYDGNYYQVDVYKEEMNTPIEIAEDFYVPPSKEDVFLKFSTYLNNNSDVEGLKVVGVNNNFDFVEKVLTRDDIFKAYKELSEAAYSIYMGLKNPTLCNPSK